MEETRTKPAAFVQRFQTQQNVGEDGEYDHHISDRVFGRPAVVFQERVDLAPDRDHLRADAGSLPPGGHVQNAELARTALAIVAIVFGSLLIANVNEPAVSIFTESYAYLVSDDDAAIRADGSNIRLEQWKGALIVFTRQPVFGIGIGNVGWPLVDLMKAGKIKDMISNAKYHGQPAHIHNAYLQYLVDTGVVGFLSLVLILGYPFFLVIKYSRVSRHAIYLAVTALCFALASVTEVPFIRNNWTSVFRYFYIVFAATMFRELRDRQQQLRTSC